MGVAKTGCPCSIIDERFRAHDWTLQAGRSKAPLGPDVSARCCPSRLGAGTRGRPHGRPEVRTATCPLSTRGGTRLVRSVRGKGGGGGAPRAAAGAGSTHVHGEEIEGLRCARSAGGR